MNENYIIHRELFRTICTKVIGEGSSRETYSSFVLPGHVVKVEDRAASFQNVIEWTVWQNVKTMPSVAKWFAPCDWISPGGSILLMRKTTPVPDGSFPTKLPEFLTDFKPSNYGMYQGNFVCHDYGLLSVGTNFLSRRLVPVTWSD